VTSLYSDLHILHRRINIKSHMCSILYFTLRTFSWNN